MRLVAGLATETVLAADARIFSWHSTHAAEFHFVRMLAWRGSHCEVGGDVFGHQIQFMFFQEDTKRLDPFWFPDHSSCLPLSRLVFRGQFHVQELSLLLLLVCSFGVLVAVLKQLLLLVFLHLPPLPPRTSAYRRLRGSHQTFQLLLLFPLSQLRRRVTFPSTSLVTKRAPKWPRFCVVFLRTSSAMAQGPQGLRFSNGLSRSSKGASGWVDPKGSGSKVGV